MHLCPEQMQLLHKGNNSLIFRYGSSETGLALKMTPSSCREAKHLKNQYYTLKALNHQNIVTVFKYKTNIQVQVPNHNELKTQDVLVMELAQHGSLINFVKKRVVKMKESRNIFRQLCEAVTYLHGKYFVHRDIKLDNILLCESENGQIVVKLADFGFASSFIQYSSSQKSEQKQNIKILFSSFKGTKRGYMAPEIHKLLELESNKNQYDGVSADVFALGVTLFALVMGKLPFEYARQSDFHYSLIIQQKIQQFWRRHLRQITKIDENNKQGALLQEFKQLFIKMVHPDPNERLSMEDVLESQWVRGPIDQIQI